jgi:RNA polymerase sigma-70 factor (ECF subfamily)
MDAPRRAELDRLCARLAEGDRSAFTPLFDALWPPLRGFCRRALGNHADGDDVAQQALVNLFARAAEYDRDRDALSWALGIAAWECRSHRRRAGRRREQALVGEAPAAGAGIDDAVILRELTAAAAEVLGTLRAADIAVIRAAITEDDAARAGVAPATFRKRLQRALDRFRAAWRSRYDVP